MAIFSEATQLAQSRPSDTSATWVYQPDRLATIETIYICNTTGSPASASIFLGWNSDTYDQTTALMYAVPIPANSTTIIDQQSLPMTSESNLAVQTGTANALTFSIYGREKIA